MTTTTTTKTKTTNGDYYEKFHLTSKIVARKRPRKSAMRPEYEFFNGKLNQNINNHQFGHMFISINFWTCLCTVSVCVCVCAHLCTHKYKNVVANVMNIQKKWKKNKTKQNQNLLNEKKNESDKKKFFFFLIELGVHTWHWAAVQRYGAIYWLMVQFVIFMSFIKFIMKKKFQVFTEIHS